MPILGLGAVCFGVCGASHGRLMGRPWRQQMALKWSSRLLLSVGLVATFAVSTLYALKVDDFAMSRMTVKELVDTYNAEEYDTDTVPVSGQVVNIFGGSSMFDFTQVIINATSPKIGHYDAVPIKCYNQILIPSDFSTSAGEAANLVHKDEDHSVHVFEFSSGQFRISLVRHTSTTMIFVSRRNDAADSTTTVNCRYVYRRNSKHKLRETIQIDAGHGFRIYCNKDANRRHSCSVVPTPKAVPIKPGMRRRPRILKYKLDHLNSPSGGLKSDAAFSLKAVMPLSKERYQEAVVFNRWSGLPEYMCLKKMYNVFCYGASVPLKFVELDIDRILPQGYFDAVPQSGPSRAKCEVKDSVGAVAATLNLTPETDTKRTTSSAVRRAHAIFQADDVYKGLRPDAGNDVVSLNSRDTACAGGGDPPRCIPKSSFAPPVDSKSQPHPPIPHPTFRERDMVASVGKFKEYPARFQGQVTHHCKAGRNPVELHEEEQQMAYPESREKRFRPSQQHHQNDQVRDTEEQGKACAEKEVKKWTNRSPFRHAPIPSDNYGQRFAAWSTGEGPTSNDSRQKVHASASSSSSLSAPEYGMLPIRKRISQHYRSHNGPQQVYNNGGPRPQ